VRLPRILAPIALTAVALLGLSACAASAVDSTVPSDYSMAQADRSDMPDAIKKILDSGRITVGTKFDQPLTGLRDDATGRIEGFDAEIARIIAQRIFGDVGEGDNLDFIETVSKNREKYLGYKHHSVVDLVIGTYSISADRQKMVDFAGPYYEAGQSIMTRKGDHIDKVSQLSGKKVCTAKGSTSVENVMKLNKSAKPTILSDYSSCRKALLDKQVDAVTTDNVILYGYADQDPDELEVSKKTFSSEPYGVGIHNNSPEVVKFINDTLKLAFSNGDWQAAFNRTLGAAGVALPKTPKITTD
jgi:glutamate transport system substrate-binding protein